MREVKSKWRLKWKVVAFLSFLKRIANQHASRADFPHPLPQAALLSFYFRLFVISTAMVLEVWGSRVARVAASKCQPRLSYIRLGLTGDPGRAIAPLAFSFSSSRSSLLLSLYISPFPLLFAKLFVAVYISRAPLLQTVFPLCVRAFHFFLSRRTTRLVAQIIVIRNNVIMFARDSSRDYPGNSMLSEWKWCIIFRGVTLLWPDKDSWWDSRRRVSFLSSTSKDIRSRWKSLEKIIKSTK